jgi:predicted RNase H-like HicB family nuclease
VTIRSPQPGSTATGIRTRVSGLRNGSVKPFAVDLSRLRPRSSILLAEFGGVGDKVRDKVSASSGRTRYRSPMAPASVDFTISYDSPDKEGWIVARILEVPGALSQGRAREEAKENVLDALRTVLTPDEELAGEAAESDREHLRFTAAA